MNTQPELLVPRQEDSTEVHPFDLAVYATMSVTVRETDGDEVFFEWDPPDALEAFIQESATREDIWTSTIVAGERFDPTLDGREVHCLIFDEAVPARPIEVTFELIVPGAEEL